jgi:hypothetical protein
LVTFCRAARSTLSVLVVVLVRVVGLNGYDRERKRKRRRKKTGQQKGHGVARGLNPTRASGQPASDRKLRKGEGIDVHHPPRAGHVDAPEAPMSLAAAHPEGSN